MNVSAGGSPSSPWVRDRPRSCGLRGRYRACLRQEPRRSRPWSCRAFPRESRCRHRCIPCTRGALRYIVTRPLRSQPPEVEQTPVPVPNAVGAPAQFYGLHCPRSWQTAGWADARPATPASPPRRWHSTTRTRFVPHSPLEALLLHRVRDRTGSPTCQARARSLRWRSGVPLLPARCSAATRPHPPAPSEPTWPTRSPCLSFDVPRPSPSLSRSHPPRAVFLLARECRFSPCSVHAQSGCNGSAVRHCRCGCRAILTAGRAPKRFRSLCCIVEPRASCLHPAIAGCPFRRL